MSTLTVGLLMDLMEIFFLCAKIAKQTWRLQEMSVCVGGGPAESNANTVASTTKRQSTLAFGPHVSTWIQLYLKVVLQWTSNHSSYLRACTRLRSVNSCRSTKAWSTARFSSSLENRDTVTHRKECGGVGADKALGRSCHC